MQNPHIVVGSERRCLCGNYIVAGTQTRVGCADVIQAAQKLANAGNPDGALIFTVLRELLVDCAD